MALSSVTDRFDILTRHIRAAVAAAAATPAHIMVAGDFDAKVGDLPRACVSTFNEDNRRARQAQHTMNVDNTAQCVAHVIASAAYVYTRATHSGSTASRTASKGNLCQQGQ